MSVFPKQDKDSASADLSALNAGAKPIPVPPSAMTPEIMAYLNTQMASTIAQMFAALRPTLESIALTPEKIELMEAARRAPSEEVVARKAREKREKQLQKEDLDEAARTLEAIQRNCAHRYATGALSLAPISNRPDRQRLLVCLKCHGVIAPRIWVVGAPDAENPRGKQYLQDAHPDYVRLIREYDVAHS
jgi:hypothetical protein